MSKPKYVIIEDDEQALLKLARGLAKSGRASLPIHVGEDFDPATALAAGQAKRVRVVFSDLHLIPAQSSSDANAHYAVIAGIVDACKFGGYGPWMLVIWTEDQEADLAALSQYLTESIPPELAPIAVASLPKASFIADPSLLPAAIDALIAGHPQIQVLLDWEEAVSEAAAETVSTVAGVSRKLEQTVPRGEGIPRVLGFMAHAAFGQRAVDDKFGAVAAVLAPLVADRVANSQRDDVHRELWQNHVTLPAQNESLPAMESAQLNTALHIESREAPPLLPAHAGTASFLPDAWKDAPGFSARFGPLDAMRTQFRIAPETQGLEWLLIAVRAPCDDAQGNPGPLPFVLGMEAPEELWYQPNGSTRVTPKQAIWKSRSFLHGDQRRRLWISANYMISVPEADTAQLVPRYRLREQLYMELVNHLHVHLARPGIVSF